MLVPLSDEVCPFEAGPGHASRVALALLPPPGQFGQVSTASENRDCHRMAFLPLVWIGSSGTPAPPVARESREALKGTRPATTTGVPGPGRLECAAPVRSYSASTPLWCLNRRLCPSRRHPDNSCGAATTDPPSHPRAAPTVHGRRYTVALPCFT